MYIRYGFIPEPKKETKVEVKKEVVVEDKKTTTPKKTTKK